MPLETEQMELQTRVVVLAVETMPLAQLAVQAMS